MTRALLQQALEALDTCGVCYSREQYFNEEKVDAAMMAIRSEIAKPEQPAPAWHDTPTCPGLWLCTEDERDPRDWVCWQIEYPEKLVGVEDQRWYGPIPKDTK